MDVAVSSSEKTMGKERPTLFDGVAYVTTRGPGDLEPYVMVEEQRATSRIEKSPPIPYEYHDFWVVIGLLIVFVLIFLVLAGFIL